MDYRRTKYCPELIDVSQKKKEVEKLVEIEHPNAKDMHRYICLLYTSDAADDRIV